MVEKKKIISHLISITFVLLFLFVATIYVYYPNKEELLSSFTFLQNQEGFYIKEISSSLSLAESYPVSDQEGMKNDGYYFKIVNSTNQPKHYQLVFKNQLDKIKKRNLLPLDPKYLRYTIQEGKQEIMSPQTLANDAVIYETTILAHSEVTYHFQVWLGEQCDEEALGKTYIGQMELKEVESSNF